MKIINNILIVATLFALLLGCARDDADGYDDLDGDDENSSVTDGYFAIERFIVEVPNLGFNLLDESDSESRAYVDSDFVGANLYIAGRETNKNYIIPVVVAYSTLVDGDDSTIVKYQFAAIDSSGISEIEQQSYMLRYIDMWDSESDYLTEVVVDNSSMSSIYSSDMVRLGLIYNYNSNSNSFEQASTATQQSDGSYVIGEGLESDPYVIRSGDEFISQITDKLDAGNTLSGTYFEQGAQIVTNKSWECAGYSSKTKFCGYYNGGSLGSDNSNSIIGLNLINSNSNSSGTLGGEVAMFYSLSGASISNLTIVNAMAYGDSAALFALESSDTTFSWVKVLSANVIGYSNLAGFVKEGSGTFNDCYNYATIDMIYSSSQTNENYGGYIAKSSGGGVKFQNSLFRGAVNAGYLGTYGSDTEASYNAGGFIGYSESDSDTREFDNCYSSGVVNVHLRSGGLIGWAKGSADIKIDNTFVGRSIDYDKTSLISTSLISGGESIGGFIGRVNDSSSTNTNTTSISVNNSMLMADLDDDGASIYVYSEEPYNCGGFIGEAYMVDFTDCYFKNYANIGTDDTNYVGGVIGSAYDCTFDACDFSNYGNIRGYNYAGGILGSLKSDNPSSHSSKQQFDNCDFKNFGSSVDARSYVGGCIGAMYINYDITDNSTKMRSYSNITSTYQRAGGVIGYLSIDNSASITSLLQLSIFNEDYDNFTGEIIGVDYVGGLIGYLYINDGSSLDMSVNTSYVTVEGNEAVGGVIGHTVNYGSLKFSVDDDYYISVSGEDDVGGAMGSLYNEGSSCDIYTYDKLQGASGEDGFGTIYIIDNNGDTASNIGGVLGHLYGDSKTVLEYCYNRMNTSSNASDDKALGGLIGRAGGPFSITNCSNVAEISGNGDNIGGLIGWISGFSYDDPLCIYDSYNSGKISGSNCLGGIVGYSLPQAYDSVKIYYCYNSGDISGSSSDENFGGFVGYSASYDRDRTRLYLHNSYNIGSTTNGTLGNDTYDAEVDRSDCYYCKDTCDGDNNSGSNATKYTKSEMKEKMSLSSSHWTDPGDSSLPYLKNITVYLDSHPSF